MITEWNGLKVKSRRKAAFADNNPVHQGKKILYDAISEVTLEDDHVVYACDSPQAPKCEYVAINPISVRAHLRVHSPRALAKQAEKDANAEVRRLAGQISDLEAQLREAVATADSNGHAPRTSVDLEKVRESFLIAAKALEKIRVDVNNVTMVVQNSVIELDNLELADPEVAEKAAKYDQFKNLFS